MSEQFDNRTGPEEPNIHPLLQPTRPDIPANPVDLSRANELLNTALLSHRNILRVSGQQNDVYKSMTETLERLLQLNSLLLDSGTGRVETSKAELLAQERLTQEAIRRADAELEVQSIMESNGKQIERHLRAINEIRAGTVRMTTPTGQRADVPIADIRRAFESPGADPGLREAVRQHLIQREMDTGAISGEQNEARIGETIRNLWSGARAGRGLSVNELMGSLRGVSLGPVGAIAAALTFLPQVMHTLEGTWERTIGFPLGQINQTRQLGMITGGGFAEGRSMRWDAFRQGFNPFDLVSRQLAREIHVGLAEEGFRGDLREALGDTVIGAVNDLGIEHAQAIDLVTQAYRRNGMSLEQISRTLDNLDMIAQSSNRSIAETTQIYTDLTTMLTSGGAGGAASRTAQTLMQAFPQPITQEQIAGLLGDQSIMAMTANFAGLPPHLLMTRPDLIPQALGQTVDFWLAQAPGESLRERAATLRAMVPAFANWGVPEIMALARSRAGGAGFEQQDVFSRAQGFFEHSLRMREEQHDVLSDIPINPLNPWQTTASHARTWGGRAIPQDQLRRLHENTLDRLRGVLTPEEVREFTSNIGKRGFDVQAFIQRARKAERVGKDLDLGGVTIGLAPDAKRFFNLRGRESEAAARGLVPTWSQYYPGQDRTAGRG